MAKITAFDWDNMYITPDEDPAYAGDKEPNSPDDIPCGEHYIPSDKTCHDGDAHDPEPGENPYWTDENSAEERNERGVDWDDNKPSEPAPEEPKPSEEAMESVPEGQWARQKDRVAQALESLEAILARAPKGNTKANGLKAAAKLLQSDDRNENLKAVEHLQNAVNEAKAFQDSPDSPPNVKGESYRARVDQAQFAVDVFNSSIETDDPRDIQVWDKLRNRPETLEVTDLIQLSPISGPDMSILDDMNELLSQWRESPTLGGADLARMFMDDPSWMSIADMQLMKRGLRPNQKSRSPLETNTKLAMAILDRSARAGDESANKMLWESFGLSEEWTPNSYLYDHNKAADKGTREMKQFADWSGIEAAQKDYMMAGSAFAEAEAAAEEFEELYQTRKKAILDYRDGDSYDRNNPEDKASYLKAIVDLEDDKDASDKAVRDADFGVHKASEAIMKEAEKIRQPIKDAMRVANKYTQIDAETAGEILHKAGNAVWAKIDDSDEDYKPGKGEGIAGLSGKKLNALRWKHRDQKNFSENAESSKYPNSAKIQATLQDLFSIAHRDVVGGPGMVRIQWEAEVMVRAYANASDGGSICLSVGADMKKVPKHEMYDKTRKYAAGEFSDREDIAIHEFAHHIEMNNTDIARRFTDFYARRTEGQPIVKKGDIDPQTGKVYADLEHYDADEEFIPDHFFTTYCGRIYRVAGERHETSELVSMGVQAFYNKHQWGAMVRDDPEHMALIIATLRGY